MEINMPEITKKSIEEAVRELKDAMLESIEAANAEENAKLRKIRAHKRLSLARDEIRSISFN